MGKRGFQRRACDSCHRRKVRCDGRDKTTPCTYCSMRGEICSLSQAPDPPKSSPPSGSRPAHPVPDPATANPVHCPTERGVPKENSPAAEQPSLSPSALLELTDAEFASRMASILETSYTHDSALQSRGNTFESLDDAEHIERFFIYNPLLSRLASAFKPDIDVSAISPSDVSPPATLRRAIVCHGLTQLLMLENDPALRQRRAALAADVRASVETTLQSQQSLVTDITLVTLVVMAQVWPEIETKATGHSSLPSPLSVDITSLEGLCRLASKRQAWEIENELWLHIYLLDTMDSAQSGRSPYLRGSPGADCLDVRPGAQHIDAGLSLGDIARRIGFFVKTGQLSHTHAHKPSIAHDIKERLSAWSARWKSHVPDWSTRYSVGVSDLEDPIWTMLGLLRINCIFSLESHLERICAGQPHFRRLVDYHEFRALAFGAWADLVNFCDIYTDTPATVTSLGRWGEEIELRVLFWGLDEARKAQSINCRGQAWSLITGSRQLIRAAKAQVDRSVMLQQRLKGIQDRLETLLPA